ncbi:MAG TPA: hypothetical protein VFA04_16660 [Bryobacteraceae bacterium]|nr:hypothetical protein [Bryobacteraceae bacterium]
MASFTFVFHLPAGSVTVVWFAVYTVRVTLPSGSVTAMVRPEAS